MTRYLLMLLLASTGCSSHYYALKAEEKRFNLEYDWSKPGVRSQDHILVQPPKYAARDTTAFVATVDATVQLVRKHPAAAQFDFGRITVWIHEATGRFVSPYGSWVTGVRYENRICVSLVERADGFVLHSLAHELFHVAFGEPNRNSFSEEVERTCQESRVPVPLSPETIDAMKAIRYEPYRPGK